MKTLSKKENNILIGSILGDAHLRKTVSKTNKIRIQISHSLSQKKYVDWKRKNFDRLCWNTKSPYISSRFSKKYNKTFYTYSFYTNYTSELIEAHSLFYRYNDLTGKFEKKIPALLPSLLNDPLSLAVWYLDDGTLRNDCDSCRIATQSFCLPDVKLLRDTLMQNFKIESKLEMWKYKKNKIIYEKPNLAILAKSFKKFKKLIIGVVKKEIPSMIYKLERPRND